MDTISTKLLRSLPLSVEDAARLVLELVEGLQLGAAHLEHDALMERLRAAQRAGIQAVRKQEHTVSFEVAAKLSLEARAGRRPVTLRDLRYYLRRFLREPGLGERPLRAMEGQECRRLLQVHFGHSPHSFRKARAILHSVFAFGLQQGWCACNPVDRVTSPGIREKEIRPLQPDAIARLEKTVRQPEHESMRLPLYLMLYCGVRPSEVQRLREEDIDWKEGVVRIRPSVSKTGGGRLVPLRFSRSGRGLQHPFPRGWARRWRALRRAAGFSRWVPDVLRHTFASYHAACFRNLPALQLEMGHRDCSLLRSRYVSVAGVSRCSAVRFFAAARELRAGGECGCLSGVSETRA